jgi:hypothetical protein
MQDHPENSKPINRIVLVGNGFDIAHNFKVSFKDFIYHFINKTIDDCVQFNEGQNIFLHISRNKIPKINFEFIATKGFPLDRIEELEKRKEYRVQKSDFFEKIEDQLNSLGWVDIEQIYFDLLVEDVKNKKHQQIELLNSTMGFLEDQLWLYLKDECNLEAKKINETLLSQICDDVYGDTEISKDGLAYKQKPDQYLFINFNYTDLLKLYFDAIPDIKRLESSYVPVHGKLEGDDDALGQKMIFGYGDEVNEEYKSFEKYKARPVAYDLIKSFKYLQARSYQKIIRFLSLAPYQVSIFGHSCGKSDRTLLRTIFNHQNCISIKPYYFKDKKGDDDYFEKSININMCFDDSERFRETLVNKMDCDPMVQVPNFNKKE